MSQLDTPAAGDRTDDLDSLEGDAARRDERAARRARRRDSFASVATLVSFGVLFVFYAFWLGDRFLDPAALLFDVSRSTPQLLLAAGLVVALACHVFDLSVGAVATLALFLTVGLHVQHDVPLPVTILLALAAGALAGLVNGLLVTKVRLNAFIATLGTAGVYGGLTVVYSDGRVIGPTADSGPLPSWYSGPGSLGDFQQKVPAVVGSLLVAVLLGAGVVALGQRFHGDPRARRARLLVGAAVVVAGTLLALATGVVRELSWAIVVLVVAAFCLWILLKYTVTGRSMYAVGGSVRAASFAGISTDATIIKAFVISGTTAALAGVMLGSIQGSAVPDVGEGLLLPAYAAAFLSTVFVSRGRFHVWGALFGGMFLIFVASGLVAGGVHFTWTQVINGAVLVAAVSLNSLAKRR
jgi:ribose/xylose/arabinose/galactoside ABC-type transport system permease subunit